MLVLRTAHRKWRESQQQPVTVGPFNMLSCCLNYFNFLWAILSTSTVQCGPLNVFVIKKSKLPRRHIKPQRGLLINWHIKWPVLYLPHHRWRFGVSDEVKIGALWDKPTSIMSPRQRQPDTGFRHPLREKCVEQRHFIDPKFEGIIFCNPCKAHLGN